MTDEVKRLREERAASSRSEETIELYEAAMRRLSLNEDDVVEIAIALGNPRQRHLNVIRLQSASALLILRPLSLRIRSLAVGPFGSQTARPCVVRLLDEFDAVAEGIGNVTVATSVFQRLAV